MEVLILLRKEERASIGSKIGFLKMLNLLYFEQGYLFVKFYQNDVEDCIIILQLAEKAEKRIDELKPMVPDVVKIIKEAVMVRLFSSNI